jgi:hypothetical protein
MDRHPTMIISSNKDDSMTKEEKKKQTYEKPTLRTIQLNADEVLAVGCKVAKGIRGFSNGLNSCAFPRTCYGNGS